LHARRISSSLRPLPGGASLRATLAEGRVGVATLHVSRGVVRSLRELLHRTARDVDALDLADAAPRQALCHGDARAPNVLFEKDRARFVDFGLAGRGDPAIDCARTLAYASASLPARFAFFDAYAHAGGSDDVIDRAVALLPAMPALLAVSAFRYALACARGTIAVVNVSKHVARLSALAVRIAMLARSARPPSRATTMRASRKTASVSIPRTAHLRGSRVGHEDIVLTDDDERVIRRIPVTIVEKLDGIAVAFSLERGAVAVTMRRSWSGRDTVHADAQRFARVHERELTPLLEGGAVLYGEWLKHRLVLRYQKLPSAVIFHGRSRGDSFEPRAISNRAIAAAGFAVMTPLFHGVVGDRAWSSFLPPRSAFSRQRPEGIIVDVQGRWTKWVAPHYRQPLPSIVGSARNRVL
jgi:hypothetical protein